MFLSRFGALGDLVLIRYAWLKRNKINSEVHSVRERNRHENVTENESTTEASASADEREKKKNFDWGCSAELTCQVNFPVKWFKRHL